MQWGITETRRWSSTPPPALAQRPIGRPVQPTAMHHAADGWGAALISYGNGNVRPPNRDHESSGRPKFRWSLQLTKFESWRRAMDRCCRSLSDSREEQGSVMAKGHDKNRGAMM